jgi:hypothetical protein
MAAASTLIVPVRSAPVTAFNVDQDGGVRHCPDVGHHAHGTTSHVQRCGSRGQTEQGPDTACCRASPCEERDSSSPGRPVDDSGIDAPSSPCNFCPVDEQMPSRCTGTPCARVGAKVPSLEGTRAPPGSSCQPRPENPRIATVTTYFHGLSGSRLACHPAGRCAMLIR